MTSFIKSSLSQKYVIALAGLFLMSFLVVHLSINLLMLAGDSGLAFSKAAGFMGSNPLIKVFEYVLFAGFAIHMLLGVLLYFQNRKARPIAYAYKTKSDTHPFSRYMIHTGVIILVFLVIHFINFFFVKLGLVAIPEGITDKHDFFNMAVALFSNPYYSAIYLVSFVFLGFHLYHAFQSAFQSLGLNHNKYTPVIKTIGLIYALLICIGFSIIPVYFLFFYQAH